MSLASLLLGKAARASDAALDAIFSRTKVVPPAPAPEKPVAAPASEASTSKGPSSSPKAKKIIAPPEHIIEQARLAKKHAAAKGSGIVSSPASKSKTSSPTKDKKKQEQQQQQQQQQNSKVEKALLQQQEADKPASNATAAAAAAAEEQTAVKDSKRKRNRPATESKARAGDAPGENISITPGDAAASAEASAVAVTEEEQDSSKVKKRKRRSAGRAGPATAADEAEAVDGPSPPKKKTATNATTTTISKSKSAKSDAKQAAQKPSVDADADDDDNDDLSEDDSSSDDGRPLVHETLLNGGNGAAGASRSRSRKVPKRQDETPALKDARTTFIGNVPVACATVKSSRKALVKHLIAALPEEHRNTIRLESIRFRSLQLSAPAFSEDGTRQSVGGTKTQEDGEGGEGDDEAKPEPRSRKRARRWKQEEAEALASAEGRAAASKQPKFLTASQKKKIGFITGDLHEKASTCNAYAVWDVKTAAATASTSSSASSSAVMTPQQMAAVVVRHANNTVFEGCTLRVDHVRPTAGAAAAGGAGAATSGESANVAQPTQSNREYALEQKAKLEEEKRTLYVGSLDFEEKEQAIRELCEKLMTEERGKPPPSEDSTAPPQWVERVRLVRDHATGLGKGFAYVMFKDRECVDEMLALDGARVKLSKRRLRLERCKSTAVKAAAKAAEERAAQREVRDEKKNKERKERSRRINKRGTGEGDQTKKVSVPRPDVGESLRELSKEERKALKSADEERLQRRMEKKQARRDKISTEKAKEALDRRVKSAAGGTHGKTRTGPAKEGLKKTRVRGEKAMRSKNKKKVIAA